MVINESNFPLDPFIPFHFRCGVLALADSPAPTQLLPRLLRSEMGEEIGGTGVRRLAA